MSSKIKPTTAAAFNIVFTKNELDRLESKIDQRALSLAEELEFISREVRSGNAFRKSKQGPKGDKGDTGSAGPEGKQGPKGDRGERGEQGPKGERGDVGPIGLTGPIGLQGGQGEKGDIGPVGPVGPRGRDGVDGARGERGAQGEKGDKGDQGFPGLQGAKGDKGDRGEQGEKGDQGPKGEKGDPGSQGAKGDKGERGEKGEAGVSAPDLTPKFEELRESFEKEIQTHQNEINKRIDQRLNTISARAAGGGGATGGGSFKILDNADVEYKHISEVGDGDVLAFDAAKKKFVATPANLAGGDGTLDSSQLFGLIDSDYILNIVSPGGNTTSNNFNIVDSFGGILINNETILSHGNNGLTSNTAVGLDALDNNLTGTNNTAIGFEALKNSLDASYNTAFGAGAGSALISGDYNVIIGGNDGSIIEGLSNQLVLSDGQGNTKIHMDSANSLYVGANADVNLSSLTITETDSVATVPIDSFSITYRTARFTIQIHETINNIHQSAEVLLLHDSVSPRLTVFGVLTTSDSDLGNFSADINNNDVRLLTTPSSANHMVYKVLRSSIKS